MSWACTCSYHDRLALFVQPALFVQFSGFQAFRLQDVRPFRLSGRTFRLSEEERIAALNIPSGAFQFGGSEEQLYKIMYYSWTGVAEWLTCVVRTRYVITGPYF